MVQEEEGKPAQAVVGKASQVALETPKAAGDALKSHTSYGWC